MRLVDFDVPNTIQLREIGVENFRSISRSGGTDGRMYRAVPVLRTVNANWNSDGWNFNANEFPNPNRWNAGNRVVSPRNYCGSSARAEVLLSKPFFQP